MSDVLFWDKVSLFYSKFMKNNDLVYKKSSDTIKPFLQKDMHVLELACGTGQFTSLLSCSVKRWIATDFSKKMVDEARANSTCENVVYKPLDATNTGYDDSSFDAVIIANALHIMPAPKLALKEINRVLKPSGLLFAPTFVYDQNIPKLRMWLLEKIGFRTYNKWQSSELANLVGQNNFKVKSSEVIHAKPLSECVIIATKKQLKT